MTFRDFQADSAPPALQHERWRALTGEFGDAKDAAAQAARDAAKAGLASECPDDALGHHARERSLERYPGESAASHRARLVAASTALEFVGTEQGLLAALTAIGYGTPTIHTAIGTGPAWYVDPWPPPSDGNKPPAWPGAWPILAGNVAGWPSRFWVNLENSPFGNEEWGGGRSWGEAGFTWGSNASAAQVQLVKRIIKRWRPAHCVCIGVFVELTTSDRIFWPTWPYEE